MGLPQKTITAEDRYDPHNFMGHQESTEHLGAGSFVPQTPYENEDRRTLVSSCDYIRDRITGKIGVPLSELTSERAGGEQVNLSRHNRVSAIQILIKWPGCKPFHYKINPGSRLTDHELARIIHKELPTVERETSGDKASQYWANMLSPASAGNTLNRLVIVDPFLAYTVDSCETLFVDTPFPRIGLGVGPLGVYMKPDAEAKFNVQVSKRRPSWPPEDARSVEQARVTPVLVPLTSRLLASTTNHYSAVNLRLGTSTRPTFSMYPQQGNQVPAAQGPHLLTSHDRALLQHLGRGDVIRQLPLRTGNFQMRPVDYIRDPRNGQVGISILDLISPAPGINPQALPSVPRHTIIKICWHSNKPEEEPFVWERPLSMANPTIQDVAFMVAGSKNLSLKEEMSLPKEMRERLLAIEAVETQKSFQRMYLIGLWPTGPTSMQPVLWLKDVDFHHTTSHATCNIGTVGDHDGILPQHLVLPPHARIEIVIGNIALDTQGSLSIVDAVLPVDRFRFLRDTVGENDRPADVRSEEPRYLGAGDGAAVTQASR
ncbi:hypothetical protein NM688_g4283 [Phlebia brevispora]|uniref:Uncharacterized protein n=1 Tax=Phlebia brevispora TaxID=194682 RepID=A0ACC1T3A4_9APHY|nr:hypothetical protein NM688_g4283 [Phlebia brevispora]